MSAVERHRNILDFTLASLMRRKGKNSALIVVYTLVVFVLASALFFTQAIRREAGLVLTDAPELVVQRLVAGRHDLIPTAYLEKIRDIRGVTGARSRLWGYYYDATVGANYTLEVPLEAPPPEGSVIVGEGLARTSGAAVDSLMPFRTTRGEITTFAVSKILPSDSSLVSADLVLLSEKDFREMFGVDRAHATDLAVTVRNKKEIPVIARKIAEALPDTRTISRDEILRTYDAVFSWRGGIMLALLAGAVLAFVIFAWDRAAGLSAEERKEIGILKAIGWETSDVLLMKFWEGVAVSLTAFLLGIVAAYVHVFFASAGLFEPVLKGWSVLYPRFRLVPFIDFPQVAALFFLTVVPYTVATVIPSWRAATVDPDAVMRG